MYVIPPFVVERLEDGCIRVSLGSLAGTVSSYHLVEPKKLQLLKTWLDLTAPLALERANTKRT